MRTFRVLVGAALASVSLVALTVDATASVPTASAKVKKFCKAADKISANTNSDSNSDNAEQTATNIRKAAKLAPTKKLNTAMKNMAEYFDALADADSPGDLADIGDETVKYGKAAAVFTGYLISNCSFQ